MKISVKHGLIDRATLLKELYRLAMEKADGKCKVSRIINFVETMPSVEKEGKENA